MLGFKDFKIFVNKRLLFKVDNLDLSTGLVALVGRNGAGKSTFFRAILGIHTEFEGKIFIDNQLINRIENKSLSKKIAIVNTKPALFGSHTVEDVLFLGRLPYQNIFARKSKEDEIIVNQVIVKLGLNVFRNQLFANLSDGEKQLVMIGRALVQNTPIILLDEPSAFLDVVNQYKILSILSTISKEENKLVLFSTHQIESLQDYCDAVLLITDQKLINIDKQQGFAERIKVSFGI